MHTRYQTSPAPLLQAEDAESPEALLDKALAVASPKMRAYVPAYLPTRIGPLSRRGTMWPGLKCNLRCYFCYYADRVGDEAHPEHAFMTLDKAKRICRTMVEAYGNNAVDIQGGEPTLWEGIFELVAYCREIGLDPTLITNGQALSKKGVVERLKEAGIRDFLVSVHALGPVYDRVVGVRGAHARQMAALKNLQEVGVPFRFNCVMSKASVPQLPKLAELGVGTGAQVVNFLNYNPFDYQRTEGRRTRQNTPTYSEVGESLNRALDVLEAAGVEGSVRHLPICVVAERHRKSIYTHHQMPYDLHENDFASWAWTGLPAQRGRVGELSHLVDFGPTLRLGPLGALRRLRGVPYLGAGLTAAKRALDRAWGRLWIRLPGRSLEAKYQADARRRANEHCGYRHVEACLGCDARPICGGIHNDYEALFGSAEASPIREGGPISDPKHFIRHQVKKVHPRDMEWLTA